jgi:hypothetical protein
VAPNCRLGRNPFSCSAKVVKNFKSLIAAI